MFPLLLLHISEEMLNSKKWIQSRAPVCPPCVCFLSGKQRKHSQSRPPPVLSTDSTSVQTVCEKQLQCPLHQTTRSSVISQSRMSWTQISAAAVTSLKSETEWQCWCDSEHQSHCLSSRLSVSGSVLCTERQAVLFSLILTGDQINTEQEMIQTRSSRVFFSLCSHTSVEHFYWYTI